MTLLRPGFTAGNVARQFEDRLLDGERLPKRQKVEKIRPLTAPFDGPSTSRAAKATEVRKPSYAAVTVAIKVQVVPEGYRKVVLSSENLSQLEDALLEEIVLSGWDSPIKFGGIHFRVGHLIVDCRNATTAEWLQLSVPSLSKWSGISLEVKMCDDLPSSHNITIFCPRTGDKTTKWIMELIKKQNDLDTENSRLISRKNEGGGSLLSLGIDDNSCAKIISGDHKLSFSLGDISVCGLKKAKAIKSGTRQVETPRNPPVSAEKECEES
ncbi:GD24766 [Drosophila simulans]|uniref:GD24766 n=1 Tax=Drosophila simulans TaxID=7240 RepID=B4NV02_DROSI|nr:GD24766 [Drosophila simulans]